MNPDTLEITISDFIKEIFDFSTAEDISIKSIIGAAHPDYRQALTDVLKNAH